MTRLIPSEEQRAILDLGLQSMRIRAGAGTGKTTTVALVIANLIAVHDVQPEQILGITFTNKAAAELADRIRETIPDHSDAGRQVEIHTYHGFAAQVLSEFGPLAGVDNRAKVITPTFARQLMSETFHHTSYEHLDITQARTLNRIRHLGDRLGDHLLAPADVVREASRHDDEVWRERLEMARTLATYSEDKRRLRVVDYSDLVALSTRVAMDHPALADEIRNRYQVVVLDEYQDTNPAQRALLVSIFGRGFPVIAVGDEDQTIYEWRGASAENFEHFGVHFTNASGGPPHERSLQLNRRSASAILDVANEVRRQANPDAEALEPVDRDAKGEVLTYWATDALAEADWIARNFESLHDSGVKWRDMAVLFRRNRDFSVVIDAMARHDIPVEVANVGGLLVVPEVAELRAWLTSLERPEDSGAITQILFGSRYGLGMSDLAPLTRWVTDEADADDSEEPSPITLIEAIEAADQIPGVRNEARQALGRFLRVYRDVLTESQGLTLVETCRLVLDRTRAWQDIEALPVNPRLTARLNVYRLLDLAEDWSPLKGRPSVAAFLEYLDAMEEEPADELDSARLSGEDAVTLVTVHRAKGLEWDTVAIPAVTKWGFPAKSWQYPDPAQFAEFLPPDLRIDDTLSDLPSDKKHRDAFLRQKHEQQEWRVAYVAVTRAKSRLLVSGAYWYGLPEPTKRPKEPSGFYEIVDSHPTTRNVGHAELVERPAVLRSPDPAAAPDPLFSGGWSSGLRLAMSDPTRIESMAAELGIEDAYREGLRETTDRLFHLAEPGDVGDPPDKPPVSVTGLVTYAQCPKRFYWTEVDPLPRERNPAAVRGTEMHRRIELHQRGQVPFDELTDELYDVAPGERSGDSGGYAAYERSRFAEERAQLVEAPFNVELPTGRVMRGRIDAIYVEGPHWEIVDFKSGRPNGDESRLVQLQAYAVAAHEVDFGIPGPDQLDVTFAYLGGGLTEQTHRADDGWVQQARTRLESITRAIDQEAFEPEPGTWCSGCDFLRFCPEGQAEVT